MDKSLFIDVQNFPPILFWKKLNLIGDWPLIDIFSKSLQPKSIFLVTLDLSDTHS